MDLLNEPDFQTEREQERALFLESITFALRDPHGYAVILHLLKEAQALESYAEPTEYRLRGIFDSFFKDIEQVDPDAALRLFAQCRGIPIVNR